MNRRSFFGALVGMAAAAVATTRAGAQTTTLVGTPMLAGPPLQGVYPRDASVNWQRNDAVDYGSFGHTTGILSLVQETNHQQHSAAFPLMIEMTATDNPNASMATAESADVYAIVRNPGPGWAAGYHLDEFHSGTGITVGENVEVNRSNPAGTVIAYNAQNNRAISKADADVAFNVQGQGGAGFKKAFNVEGTGSVLSAAGRDELTVDPDGRAHLGPSPGGNLEMTPDHNTQVNGNLWLSPGSHLFGGNGKVIA